MPNASEDPNDPDEAGRADRRELADLREAAAVVGIQRLQGRYADAINRRAFDELTSLFTEDCPVTIDTRTREPFRFIGPTAIGDFISAAVERFDFFEFVILSTRIEVDGVDTAHGRLYLCEIRHEAASGTRSEAFGVYHDRYRRSSDGSGWRFEERRYHSLARSAADPSSGRDLDVFAFPPPDQ